MTKLILTICIALLTAMPVSAMDFAAPQVPPAGEYYMPENAESFSEGLWYILKAGISKIKPDLAEAAGICLALIAVNLLVSLVDNTFGDNRFVTQIVGTLGISTLLLTSGNSMITLGVDTVKDVSEYGKLLLPVMTGALAAQGGAASSAALYAGTVFFTSLMSALITKCLIPLTYVYLCFCIVSRGMENDTLGSIRNATKSASVWMLKTILYTFTGYMTITGVVSGTTDAAAIKAAKITISGVVPVVGGILSDASEAVVVSAGILKNAAGVYGLLAILSVCIGPFLTIGIHYLLLKLSASVSSIIGAGKSVDLVLDFATALGLILAMLGTVCLMLLISAVCFMKGVG
jgi:stage III sporulation protein AE